MIIFIEIISDNIMHIPYVYVMYFYVIYISMNLPTYVANDKWKSGSLITSPAL